MRLPAKRVIINAALALAIPAAFGLGVAQEAAVAPSAIVLDVSGAIGPATTEYLRQGFKAATDRRAKLVILRMDTPGGLDTAMREIVRDILASPMPIVTYVSPSGARAASAGTYILYASHVAAMAPGTNLGAATPVQLGGGGTPRPDGPGDSRGDEKSGPKTSPIDTLANKAVNDAAAYLRGLAELHGRNAEWAEAAVRQSASLPAREALQKGVIEIIAADLDDLLRQANGRSVRIGQERVALETDGLRVVAIEPNWRTWLLAVITNPNIAFILMLVGIYGLIFEFMNPGTVLSGVVGAICLAIGLFALNLLPINYAGIALIALGIALWVAEAFTPSFGALGISGTVAFAIGSIFLFEGDVPGFTLSPAVIVAATGIGAALVLVAGTVAVRSRRHPVVTGNATLIGRSGLVRAWSGSAGEVQLHGERWQARATSSMAPGQRVRVIGRDGLTLFVEPDAERGPTE
jgi:membrane-bound serine protease (ClpP class)